jgi:phage-related minor tail protein
MNFIEYWREFVVAVGLISAYFGGRKSKGIQERKDNALAAQEEIKIKKEETELSSMIQDVYKKMIDDFSKRLEEVEKSNLYLTKKYGEVEKSNLDLTQKYGEILLRNAILEERADTYEQKYEGLKLDYTRLKLDYDKIHKENKEIIKELDELKNNAL